MFSPAPVPTGRVSQQDLGLLLCETQEAELHPETLSIDMSRFWNVLGFQQRTLDSFFALFLRGYLLLHRKRHHSITELHLDNLVEMAKVSSQNRVQQRFEEQSVGQERISERRVEQFVDGPAGHMAEVSQSPGETVEANFGRSSSKGTPTGTSARLRQMS